ncbi:hypothetical protein F8O07_07015 [Pseudoclavibacter sp. CFCC 13796]|uniref:hypothetical protein n=1 Tax=Pseudoclavibacter sp. CFCC 13796 TaxID=2615179 RepID=UPI0013012CE8|nr:hypothetical protein [Pseudoclavibacter sp. CFCC 13796]KAB1661650.1 hypothetical protein F8O07_07015 [Pseudoclavibacter sp. CFCC 13796]
MTETTANFAHYPFLLDEGQTLLLPGGSAAIVKLWDDFAEQTGIPLEDCSCTPMVALPIPVAGAVVTESLNIDELWLPWLWMPERLGRPTEGESSSHWQLRVALETVLNGLYDSDLGEWVDALGVVGLDSTDADVLNRAAAHLLGDPDQLLSTLSDTLYPHANMRPAWEIADQLEPLHPSIAWHAAAKDLAAFLDVQAETASTARELANAAEWACTIGGRIFSNTPPAAPGQPTPAKLLKAVQETSVPTWKKYQKNQVTAEGGPFQYLHRVFDTIVRETEPAVEHYRTFLDADEPEQQAIEAGSDGDR